MAVLRVLGKRIGLETWPVPVGRVTPGVGASNRFDARWEPGRPHVVAAFTPILGNHRLLSWHEFSLPSAMSFVKWLPGVLTIII